MGSQVSYLARFSVSGSWVRSAKKEKGKKTSGSDLVLFGGVGEMNASPARELSASAVPEIGAPHLVAWEQAEAGKG